MRCLYNGIWRIEYASISLDVVQPTVWILVYRKDNFHFVRCKVEDAIPDRAPEPIVLACLDADWYESTRDECARLFPYSSSTTAARGLERERPRKSTSGERDIHASQSAELRGADGVKT